MQANYIQYSMFRPAAAWTKDVGIRLRRLKREE